jgi:hypothetical protein
MDSPWAGLFIEAAVGSNYSGERAFKNIIGWSAADVYKSGQYGIGYRIPDVGFARFQFIGSNLRKFIKDYPYEGNNFNESLVEGLSTNRDANVIEIAFLYDGTENLNVEIGAKIPLEFSTGLPLYRYHTNVYNGLYPYETIGTNNTDHLTVQEAYSITLGASYRWDNLNVLGRLDYSFGGKYVHEGKRTIKVGQEVRVMVSADYRILTPLRVGLDLAFNFHALDSVEELGKIEYIGKRPNDIATTERKDFGFAPWVALDLGGGVAKMGVAVMIPSSGRWNYDSAYGKEHPWKQLYTGKPIVSVPISITYSF